ncbi:Fungal trans [Geosmithia morbida]|uniref:Fungal trans n=1 Tax=Geosmithia morbida TaxID=1094350 RepID=A0A9P4YR17_9HYPO|nr:Fungal trans [Geosmithia morbida]KAF4120118.1 Fungal trans [Geosmithia morbida]
MTTTNYTREGSEGSEIAMQENISSHRRSGAARISNKQHVRHRASVACASCRDRRIRCVVPQGQSECNQCRRAGTECIIKNDDERRRPVSKAYMSSLSDRISLLEAMLKEKGVIPPPACHPPKTKNEAQRKPDEQLEMSQNSQQQSSSQPVAPLNANSPSLGVPSPPDSANGFIKADTDQIDASTTDSSQILKPPYKEDSPLRMLDSKQESIVHRLLSAKENLSFDQLSGRLRFFGPTANSHVYAESPDQLDSREPPEQVRRAERIIRSLNPTTYSYLMNHFWEYYNSIIPIIDRGAFEADRDSRNPKFYSSFLHIAILAMGYRGCDKNRGDTRRISLGNLESTLHREAKYMVDIEIERPGGIPSVQALLLLGDLECGVGRDNTGWMYAGMANRLAFDIGLHLNCRNDGISEKEVHIRQMVMKACVVYDKYWALFLGRPTSIKSQDLDLELVSDRLSTTHKDLPTTFDRDVNMEIYEKLIELMELSGRIVEMRSHKSVKKTTTDSTNMFAMNEAEDNAYLHVINLDRMLQNWYRRLPEHLAWRPANIKTAPYGFFLLHQQYHVTMILLHRSWAKYDSIAGDSANNSPQSNPDFSHKSTSAEALKTQVPGLGECENTLRVNGSNPMVHGSRASLSRSICTQQAIRVARIFWQHRQRFDGRKIFVTGIQHAGTAVIALIAALANHCNEADRRTYMGYLEILSGALADMSYTYHPAGRMNDLLGAVMGQIRLGLGEAAHIIARDQVFPFNSVPGSTSMSDSNDVSIPVIPSGRESSDANSGYPYKRMRSSNSRRASEFARPPPPFFQTTETPPGNGLSALKTSIFGQEIYRHEHSPFDSTFFPLGLANGSSIDFSFLDESAVDTDPSEQQQQQHTSLVTPSSSDVWSYRNFHSDHQSGSQGLESGTGEYSRGPAGLSAGSVIGHDSADTAEAMLTTNFGVSKGGNDIAYDIIDSNTHMKISGVSPVNMDGLVQSVEGTPDGVGGHGDGSRNRNLDFFSFN